MPRERIAVLAVLVVYAFFVWDNDTALGLGCMLANLFIFFRWIRTGK